MTAFPRRQNACCRPRPSLAPRCPCRCCNGWRSCRKTCCIGAWRTSRAREFLYETHLFPDHAYTFKHALTREVAYGSLLHERRRALHSKIVEALEALYPDRLGEYAERLAQHALRGEVWEKAVPYCRQAGEKARNRGALREAVTRFEQALDALGHLPEHPDTGVLAIELHHRLGAMLSMVGEHRGVSPCWARPRRGPDSSAIEPGWEGCCPGW